MKSKISSTRCVQTAHKKAFTLVELLIVIVIIGILFAVLISRVDFAPNEARSVGSQADLTAFRTAVSLVALDYSGFTDNLPELAAQLNNRLDSDMHFSIATEGDYLISKMNDPWGYPYLCFYISAEDLEVEGSGSLKDVNQTDIVFLSPESETSLAPIICDGAVIICSGGSDGIVGVTAKLVGGRIIFGCEHGSENSSEDDVALGMTFISSNDRGELVEATRGFGANTESEVEMEMFHAGGDPATCTTPQVCTDCGIVVKEALGHSYNSVVTAPTCTSTGYTTHTCSRCNDTYKDSTVSALGHTPGASATCTTDQICTVCNTTLVSALGHTPGAAATCTIGQLCSTCGIELTAANGHTPGAEATCTENQICTVCNTVLNSANGHVPGASATCTTNQTCTVCGTVLNEANGHTPGASATCTTAQTCVVCSAELTAAKGHTEVIDAAVAATCTTTGLTEGKHCSVCNEVLVAQNTVNALGHTETKGGTEAIHSKCSVCGTTISSTHSFTNNKTSSKCRTCTCGYVDTAHTYTKTKTSGTCRTCSDCGYKDTSHGNYTKNKTSSKCRTCGDCGYVDTAHGNYTYHATASKCRTCGDCGYVYTSHSGSCCSYCGYTSSVTWTKYSCTYVQGNGYTEDNSHVGETTSWLRLVLLYNEYIDKDNWDSSATTNYTCHGKSYTGTDWYFSSSYGYSPSGEIHFTSNDDLSSLRSKVIGAYVVNGNSGSDRVYRIDSISSYSVNFGTSYGGLDIDGTFTCVASATKAQDTYTKGSTSYGTYTVDAGANPESTGYIVDGSNTGSYCVMYQNGTYYYYVAS